MKLFLILAATASLAALLLHRSRLSYRPTQNRLPSHLQTSAEQIWISGEERTALSECSNHAVTTPVTLHLVSEESASFALPDDGSEILIGRSPIADWVISDRFLSAGHIRAHKIASGESLGVAFIDAGSTNGTLLESGTRLGPGRKVILRHGETIRLGGSTLRVACHNDYLEMTPGRISA